MRPPAAQAAFLALLCAVVVTLAFGEAPAQQAGSGEKDGSVGAPGQQSKSDEKDDPPRDPTTTEPRREQAESPGTQSNAPMEQGLDGDYSDALPDSLLEASVETGAALPDSAAYPALARPTDGRFGYDIGRVATGSLADLLESAPGIRAVGSGWPGHWTSMARGPLPATLSQLAVAGRVAEDWAGEGVHLLEPAAAETSVPAFGAGPDLSLWRSHGFHRVVAVGGGPGVTHGGRTVGAGIGLEPWPYPGPVPFARFALGRGRLGWRVSSIEFSAQYQGGKHGVSGFYDEEEGRAPAPGGAYDSEHAGFGAAVALRGGWLLALGGLRGEQQRSVPGGESAIDPLLRENVRSEADILATNGVHSFRLYRTGGWNSVRLNAGSARGAETSVVGMEASVAVGRFFVRRFTVALERRAADGSLLISSLEATGFRAALDGSLDLTGGWQLLASMGVNALGRASIPTASVLVVRGRSAPGSSGSKPEGGAAGTAIPALDMDPPNSGTPSLNVAAPDSTASKREAGTHDLEVWVGVDVGGRHPTAIERRMRGTTFWSGSNAELEIAGSSGIDPERAAVVEIGAELLGSWVRIGAIASAARLIAPIVIAESGTLSLDSHAAEILAPANGDDETVGSISIWGEVGERRDHGVRVDLDLLFSDDSGALNSLSPAPTVGVTGRAWIERPVFKGYARAGLVVRVDYRAGLDGGPWAGALDDSYTVAGLTATARVRAANLFVAVDNLFDERAEELWPGRVSGERTMSAGFSWDFWN